MKAAKKVALIVAACFVGVGLLLACIATLLVRKDFSKLNTEVFNVETFTVSGDFENIVVSGTECDLRIRPSTNEQATVTSPDSNHIHTDVKVEDNTLTVTRQDNRAWYERIGIWWDWGNDSFTTTLYLPKSVYDSLSVTTVSGDIYIPRDFTFSTIRLKTTSGEISLANADASEVEVTTTSGEIALTDMAAATLKLSSTSGDAALSNVTVDALTFTTTSGDVMLSRATVDTLTFTTTSGELMLSDVIANGHAKLKSISGDISMTGCDAGSFTITTTSGDVSGSLLSPKDFTVNTVSGDIRVPQSDSTAGECTVTTTSGDVSFTVKSAV